MLNGQFKISVNVNKFSNFLNLAQTVVDELDITAQMSQNNKGFLQGKDVTVKAFGNTQELKAFKRIMESFMTIENNVSNKQVRL
jgi:trehalose-6-phosphate synthase